MPPQFALLICILVIVYLFRSDRENVAGVSGGIWIPLIWMLIVGSRYVSSWLGLGMSVPSGDVDPEGSPLDRAVFLILIIFGAMILRRRQIDWHQLFVENRWMGVFFIFGAISILWSDYPFVSFKRWIKSLGNVIMVLIILTEHRPYEAIGVILRRLAFLLLPLSVLFIKYYPELGRAYHMGNPMFTGVASQKNGLGQLCLLTGIYFSWDLLLNRRGDKEIRPLPFSIYLIILPMIAWLLYMANSATSITCLGIAVSLFLVAQLPAVAREPHRVLTLTIASLLVFGVLEVFFGFSESVIVMLGRTPDLTTRVPMWQDLLAMVKDPIIGFGYGSFWLGDRSRLVFERWGITGQAHNGYLQLYLDLGLIGLFIQVAWILSGLRKIANRLSIDYPSAMFRLCLVLVVVLYNWTEASFQYVSNMWLAFFLGAMDIPCCAKPEDSTIESEEMCGGTYPVSAD